MAIKIEQYDKPFMAVRGRRLTADTLALIAAIEKARDTGKAQKWVGAAKEYMKNSQRLRGVGRKQLELELSITTDGDDLAFMVKGPSPEPAPEPTASDTPPRKTTRKR